MTEKQFRNRVRLLIILTLVLIMLTSFAAGKYITSFEGYNATVTFSAHLAANMEILEHPHSGYGVYTLKTEEKPIYTSTAGSYDIIPGVDIPKDSYVKISGKTDIPAYLRIEVSSNNPAVSWEINDTYWKEKDGAYFYWDTENDEPKEITADLDKIYIFKGNEIRVSDSLLDNGRREFEINIKAILEEIHN